MFDIEYSFTFCDKLPKKCNGREASVIEFLDIYDTETDTCEILGNSDQSVYHLLDDKDANKGIMVAYTGGAICSGSDTPSLNGLPRKVLFSLECADTQDTNVSYLLFLDTYENSNSLNLMNLEEHKVLQNVSFISKLRHQLHAHGL